MHSRSNLFNLHTIVRDIISPRYSHWCVLENDYVRYFFAPSVVHFLHCSHALSARFKMYVITISQTIEISIHCAILKTKTPAHSQNQANDDVVTTISFRMIIMPSADKRTYKYSYWTTMARFSVLLRIFAFIRKPAIYSLKHFVFYLKQNFAAFSVRKKVFLLRINNIKIEYEYETKLSMIYR